MNQMEKVENIKKILKKSGGAAVAFSGGADSSLLAYLAKQSLDGQAIAVTANLSSLAEGELEDAQRIAREIGIRHFIVDYNEFNEAGFAENSPDRCYYCKRGLFKHIKTIAEKHGISVIVEGTNASEIKGRRPGYQAAIEAGVLMPYVKYGVTANEIRAISKKMGLSTFDKPTMACLSSRFPYGQKITRKSLRRVDLAEAYLKGYGITQLRVRDHNNLARIEVEPQQFDIILHKNAEIHSYLKKLGFKYITLDIKGFQSGSMDESSSLWELHTPCAGN